MFFAVEGAAGCGKTFALMSSLGDILAREPLHDGQRVLALTFMHGAKHRLNERMRSVANLRGRFECSTIDSFAWRLMRRWRELSVAIGIPPVPVDQYDAQCDAAATILCRPEVLAWVVATFPIIVVDEAQDLRPQRLRMIQALALGSHMLVAADEFQCLDSTLLPNPLVSWLHEFHQPLVLDRIRRTSVPALLAASSAIRVGAAPVSADAFRIMTSRGANMAPAFLANAIAWRTGGGDLAVITPSLRGDFARHTVGQVCQRACGQQRNGPYQILWETANEDQIDTIARLLVFEGDVTLNEVNRLLDALEQSGPIRAAKSWADHQARAAGKQLFNRTEILEAITREISSRRQHFAVANRRFTAMTVPQAKNREFDHVVVLWPFQVGGTDDHKRRLLYNAVTRARRSCTVIVQGQAILQSAPFS